MSSRPTSLPFFCQSTSLLFQFILSEFVSASTHIHTLQSSLELIETADLLLIKEMQHFCSRLSKLWSKASPDPSWNLSSGCLDKLSHYCRNYCKIGSKGKREMDFIIRKVNEALRLVYLAEENLDQPTLSKLKVLKRILSKLCSEWLKIMPALVKILTLFRFDENVISLWIRLSDPIDHSQKPGFAYSILLELHPKGISELQPFLSERFSKRGLNHILPTLENRIKHSNFEALRGIGNETVMQGSTTRQ